MNGLVGSKHVMYDPLCAFVVLTPPPIYLRSARPRTVRFVVGVAGARSGSRHGSEFVMQK